MTATFEGKDGVLHLVDGNKRYSVTDKGLTTIAELGEEAVPHPGSAAEQARALNEALIHAEENAAKLSADTKKALGASIQHVTGVEAERLGRIKTGFGEAAKLATAANLKEAEGIIANNPLAHDLASEAGIKKLADLGFDKPAFEAAQKAIKDKLVKVKGLNEELTKLLTAEKPSKEAVKAFIKTNQAYLDELTPAVDDVNKFHAATKFNFNKAISDIKTAVTAQVTEAKNAAAEFVKQTDIIKSKPNAEALKAATEAQAAAQKRLDAVLSHEYSGYIKAQIPEEVAKDLGKVSPEMGAKFGAAANAASKTSWGWTNKLGPKAEGIMGAVWKNRGWGGRGAILAGAGAVTYAIVSAIGGKGPSERVEAVNKGREGQAAGASVA